MKFTLGLFLLINSICFGQDTLSYYMDNWGKCCSEKEGQFIRKVYNKGDRRHCKDFYISGELSAEGLCIDDSANVKNGEWRDFYKSGQTKAISNYSNGMLSGEFKSWYYSGELRCEGQYLKDSMDGDWYWYNKKRQTVSHEKYNDGKMESIVFWDSKGREIRNPKREIEPVFKGGEQKMINFISKKVKYPYEAYEKGIKGLVEVSFVVNKDGSISQIKIKKSVHPLLDQAALDVVSKMPDWKPGYQHNLPVRVRYTLPIDFQF